MFIISPSVLAADFSQLGAEIKKVEKAGAQYIHLDVMDGIFVPNMSFGAPVIASIRRTTSIIFDVHLMITEPQRYIDDFLKAGADIITIHYESCENPAEVIRYIKSKEARAALAIKPATPPEVVYPLLGELDMVLVMTVEPGFGGQKMMPETIEKVRAIRTYANKLGIDIDIQVDGGINADNLKYATEAGANVIVAGSAIFNAPRARDVIEKMKHAAELYPFGSGLAERVEKGKVKKRV
ncbi:MAG: ribulose-phosphate 3-epimerase [Clostridia bacterium]|nr:ribulose-phosphate 3-epimerase [Clostridia bacterium]